MYSVLIVDDEPFVRQGLKAIINWEQYGFSVCGEASDSMEAMELIGKFSPELVLTDIMMPQVDGLELIEMSAKLWGTNTRFVILSGYDRFDFVKKAIGSNVVSYLLKPVDEVELAEVLTKVKSGLDSGKKIIDNFHLEARNVIKGFIEGKISGPRIKLGKKIFGEYFSNKARYLSIEVNILDWLENLSEGETEAGLSGINSLLLQMIGAENSIFLYEEALGEYGIILNESVLKYYGNDLKAFTEKLHGGINEKSSLPCAIFVGESINTLTDLKISYDSIKRAKGQKLFYCAEDIVFYEMLEKPDNEADLMDGLIAAVKENDIGRAGSHAAAIIEKVQEEHLGKENLQVQLRFYLFEINRFIMARHGDPEEFRDFYTKLADISGYNIREIGKILMEFSVSAAAYLKFLNDSRGSNVLEEIVSYIKSNFRENLSLKILAKRFFISPVYLGQLFKKKYDILFNDYLNNIRIEESKKLLRRSNLKLSEIANRVGYEDPNYFITKFEKITHMTPTQYKESK